MKRLTFFSLLVFLGTNTVFNCCADEPLDSRSIDGVVQPARAPLSYQYFSYYDSDAQSDQAGTAIESRSGRNDDALPRRAPQSQSNVTWSRKSIQSTSIDIREAHSVVPPDRSSDLNYGSGDWNQFHASSKVFAWAAPDICYSPLYFEDVALERYGQTSSINVQPVRSAVHFFKSVVFLPNQMRHDHPQSCDYPLGFCRPGSNVPCTKQLHYLGQPNR